MRILFFMSFLLLSSCQVVSEDYAYQYQPHQHYHRHHHHNFQYDEPYERQTSRVIIQQNDVNNQSSHQHGHR